MQIENVNVLTKEMIQTKTKTENLSQIINLNFWGSEIENIDIIEKLTNIETITLSTNKIKSLKSFSKCLELRELFLRKNLIENLNEINYLIHCSKLKVLWLGENPCCKMSEYRLSVIGSIPQLNKLDNIVITDIERENAERYVRERGSSRSGKGAKGARVDNKDAKKLKQAIDYDGLENNNNTNFNNNCMIISKQERLYTPINIGNKLDKLYEKDSQDYQNEKAGKIKLLKHKDVSPLLLKFKNPFNNIRSEAKNKNNNYLNDSRENKEVRELKVLNDYIDVRKSNPKLFNKNNKEIERLFSDNLDNFKNNEEEELKLIPVKKILSCGPKNQLIYFKLPSLGSDIKNNFENEGSKGSKTNRKTTNTPLLDNRDNDKIIKQKEGIQYKLSNNNNNNIGYLLKEKIKEKLVKEDKESTVIFNNNNVAGIVDIEQVKCNKENKEGSSNSLNSFSLYKDKEGKESRENNNKEITTGTAVTNVYSSSSNKKLQSYEYIQRNEKIIINDFATHEVFNEPNNINENKLSSAITSAEIKSEEFNSLNLSKDKENKSFKTSSNTIQTPNYLVLGIKNLMQELHYEELLLLRSKIIEKLGNKTSEPF